MPQSHHTFRVFVSSTFSDLKAERNALQARVFPRLRELCAQHGARFQPIDLRWGVSEEASLDQQAMNICLGEVKRCQQISPRPNFIVLLGDRYGWMPPPPQIPAEEFDKILQVVDHDGDKQLLREWYSLDKNAVPAEYRLKARLRGKPYEKYEAWQPVEARLQSILGEAASRFSLLPNLLLPYTASATHQEIAAGALDVDKAGEHVYCFFREIEGIPAKFNAPAFLQEIDKRLREEYPGGIPRPAFGEYLAQIKQINPSANAREFNEKIQALLDNAPRGSLERDFLAQVQGWLFDFCGKDFLNLVDEDWTPDQKALESQNELKAQLEAHVPGNVYHYPAKWTGRGTTTGHIDQLCEDVYQALSKIILSEIEKTLPTRAGVEGATPGRTGDALDEEVAAHRAFGEERLAHFIGRTDILGAIADYLKGSESQILAIYGKGGTGKSALAAKAIQQAQAAALPGSEMIYRFIGATPGSSDGRALLDSLCREVSRRYGASESDLPVDYKDLVPEFGKRLSLATAQHPLVLFIDSLDQLSSQQGARNLVWLPDRLPDHVHLVVTTRDGEDTFKRLQSKGAKLVELKGLSAQDGDQLLTAWLKQARRTLQDTQRAEVLSKFKASGGAPLYLKLAFEEARLWPSGDGQPPERLEPGIEGIIEKNMIDRLQDEGNHGEMLVSHVLGYLAASRYGLAEDEIIDLISRDLQVYEWFFKKSYHLPADLVNWAIRHLRDKTGAPSLEEQEPDADEERAALAWLKEIRNPPEQVAEFLKEVLPKAEGPKLPVVLWSRLSFDLAPYLSERTSEGSTLLAFYHRELDEVSKRVFLMNANKQPFHEKLADYFRFKADPARDRSWSGNYPRGLSELPYHQTEAEQWDEVYETLTDFRFLEEKAAKVGVMESRDEKGQTAKTYTGVLQLQEDYERALAAMPGGGGAGSWGDRPPLILTAIETSKGLLVYCPVCNQYSPIKREMLDAVIQCPQENCSAGIKLNPFTVKREI